MQRTSLLMLLVLLTAYNTQQALEERLVWYSPFLIALAVIVFAALLQQDKRNDDS
jgi:hypothetical protein